ncbi:MAG TPA: DNA circularization N-terminal domain-containing protein [Polyangiaceae bacterium]|jgi:prophage DNA circulation protein
MFWDNVQQASWAGFPFPVNEIQIIGQARIYVHEYPHADGGNIEPLGRKPYRIRMRMTMDENDVFYPDAYPTQLDNLRFLAESGTSAKLVIPNVGTITAFCPSWTQTWRATVRSGENADYEFIEDQRATLKQVFFTGISSATSMQQKASDLTAQKPTLDALGTDPSLLTNVLNAANDVIAIRDRADLTAQLAADKIASLNNALAALDDALTTPYAVNVIESLKQLWQTNIDFAQDVTSTLAPPATYTVPSLLGIADVSRNIYGDTAHQVDLLAWNAIEDAFAIPAGTPIRYLPNAA